MKDKMLGSVRVGSTQKSGKFSDVRENDGGNAALFVVFLSELSLLWELCSAILACLAIISNARLVGLSWECIWKFNS